MELEDPFPEPVENVSDLDFDRFRERIFQFHTPI